MELPRGAKTPEMHPPAPSTPDLTPMDCKAEVAEARADAELQDVKAEGAASSSAAEGAASSACSAPPMKRVKRETPLVATSDPYLE